MKPCKQQRSKQRRQDLCWKVHDRAQSLFCAHTLYLNYAIRTRLYWLVPQFGVNSYCVLSTVKAKNANKPFLSINYADTYSNKLLKDCPRIQAEIANNAGRTIFIGMEKCKA